AVLDPGVVLEQPANLLLARPAHDPDADALGGGAAEQHASGLVVLLHPGQVLALPSTDRIPRTDRLAHDHVPGHRVSAPFISSARLQDGSPFAFRAIPWMGQGIIGLASSHRPGTTGGYIHGVAWHEDGVHATDVLCHIT